ncbi:MAG: AAA family ATPase [Myxococcales bacterium]|nr:AAA family ATPase [Myxococcales bacterium]
MTSTEDDTFQALLRRAAKTPEVPDRRSRVQPGTRLAGRFEVHHKLGQGGMGQVYAAFDHELQCEVALKLLGQVRPESIGRIKSEFRAAAGLLHENLVKLHQLFADAGEWFFTMERVYGESLSKLLAGPGSRDPETLGGLFAQLAAAIETLHHSGTLHRDLKPSNVLVSAADRRVVLLDFGLALPTGAHRADASGTPRYMAPEQRRGEPLAEAADWYAFGAMLHEALGGALPAKERALAQLAAADSDLSALCAALLQPKPEARPRGAEVLARLGVRAPVRPSLPASRPQTVGRGLELRRLHEAYRACRTNRQPRLLLVHGPSGIGKSHLVEHFLAELRAQWDPLVLSARCREREALPFKAVDGLIDGVVAELERLPAVEAMAALPEDIFSLTPLFAALRTLPALSHRAPDDAEGHHGDAARKRARATVAFCELLGRLERDAPSVLWLDDLQWSDTDSAQLLLPLLVGPFSQPLMLIAACRGAPGGGRRGALIEALCNKRDDTTHGPLDPIEIEVGPLEAADAERMARELLPDQHERAASIAGDSQGHPLFIAELSHLHEQAGEARSLAGAIGSRLQRLPTRARALLELVAIGGQPLPRNVLGRAQGLMPSELEAMLDVLRAERLLQTQGLRQPDLVELWHDRIRDIVVESLGPLRRRQHHLGLAQTLGALVPGSAARQAAHFEAAGERARAGKHWIDAAEDAMAALAFSQAAEFYARGLELAELERDARLAAQLARARALGLCGRGPEAADVYLALLPGVARDEGLELRRRAAEQLLLSGHLERGLGEIEWVVHATGMRPTRGGLGAVVALVLQRGLGRLRGLGHRPRGIEQLSRTQLVQLDACFTIARSLGLVDPIRGAEFQTRYLSRALRAGEPLRLLRALSLEAVYAATAGPRAASRCQHLLQMADQLARQARDDSADTLLLIARAMTVYLQGHNRKALQLCHQALERLDRRGDEEGAAYDRMNAERIRIATLFNMGRFDELHRVVPPLLAEFEGAGNLYATAAFRTGYSTVAWLARDRLEDAGRQYRVASRESARFNFQLVHNNLMVGQTFHDLYLGQGQRAYARMQRHWGDLIRAQYLRIPVLGIQAWLLRGAAAVSAAEELTASGRRDQASAHLRDALRASNALRREPLLRALAMADLIAAAVQRQRGRAPHAQQLLQAALARFDDEDMAMYAAATRIRLGELLGGAAGRTLIAEGHERMTAERVANPQRMLSMLAPGFGPAPEPERAPQ